MSMLEGPSGALGTVTPGSDGSRDQDMAQPLSLPPFKFEQRRSRIEWSQLNGLDVSSIARNNDIDALEHVVNVIARGDIEAEDTSSLSQAALLKLYKLAAL